MGLAIVKGMAELHGGSVEAFSEGLGKGSRFTVRLPLPEAYETGRYKGIEEHRSSRSLRILVIDDIVDIAETLSLLLQCIGHETMIANDGAKGLEFARKYHPDVIICDIGLPGISGYEVAQSIRNDEELKGIFLVALTGYAQPDDLEKTREAGFQRHLTKPVDLATLENILDEV